MTAADLLSACPDCRRDGTTHHHPSHEGVLR
jgi:hypothetical protein